MVLSYLPTFLGAFLVTLEISVLTIIFSLPLGLGGALLRTAPFRFLRIVTAAYVEVIRNIPLLVLLYLFFFGLPGIGIELDSFQSGLLGLTINSTAYVIEIFRGALLGIPTSQYQAAYSLGMRPVQVRIYVIFPQLFRIALPALGNQVVGVILGSSLVSAIGVSELTQASYQVGSVTYRYFEVFTVAAILYFIAVQIVNVVWRFLGARHLAAAPPGGGA